MSGKEQSKQAQEAFFRLQDYRARTAKLFAVSHLSHEEVLEYAQLTDFLFEEIVKLNTTIEHMRKTL